MMRKLLSLVLLSFFLTSVGSVSAFKFIILLKNDANFSKYDKAQITYKVALGGGDLRNYVATVEKIGPGLQKWLNPGQQGKLRLDSTTRKENIQVKEIIFYGQTLKKGKDVVAKWKSDRYVSAKHNETRFIVKDKVSSYIEKVD
ncbi:hypothetical protein ACFLYH_02590 [Candidatus Dependentiae bacterium]